MAERITITIPDGLYKRLQAVKDRINVSGECQGAIMKAVEREELEIKNIPAMEKLAERLRMERGEHEEDWKDTGMKDGRSDAMNLGYADFKAIENGYQHLIEQGWPQVDDLTGTHVDEVMGSNGWLAEGIAELEKRDHSFDENSYLQGWLEGVMEVWEEVKTKI